MTISGRPGCLIIVPRQQVELYHSLMEHFSKDPNITVRLDARSGDRASDSVAIFASGGGTLAPAVRADVETQIRLLESRLGGCETEAP